MPQMGAQGGLGQQYDGPDEQKKLLRWSWPAVGFAQMSKMSFPSAVALVFPTAGTQRKAAQSSGNPAGIISRRTEKLSIT